MGRLLLLALLVAVGGLLLFSHREATAAEKQLAVVAGELAGRPVQVRCQGMIGAHGGSVEALPGPDGRGTTIRITLPRMEP